MDNSSHFIHQVDKSNKDQYSTLPPFPAIFLKSQAIDRIWEIEFVEFNNKVLNLICPVNHDIQFVNMCCLFSIFFFPLSSFILGLQSCVLEFVCHNS